jgi:hypothetical protein
MPPRARTMQRRSAGGLLNRQMVAPYHGPSSAFHQTFVASRESADLIRRGKTFSASVRRQLLHYFQKIPTGPLPSEHHLLHIRVIIFSRTPSKPRVSVYTSLREIMSAEKRPAAESLLSAGQLVKRQKSDANINGNRTVAIANGSAQNGALIQSVCSVVSKPLHILQLNKDTNGKTAG